MTPLADGVFPLLLLITFLLLVVVAIAREYIGLSKLLTGATPLRGGLRSLADPKTLAGRYVLSELSVESRRWGYVGRADHIVVSKGAALTLDAVIEMKFPRVQVPRTAHSEDLFQASLYALALEEMGLQCDNALAVVVYCAQTNAERCRNRDLQHCISCGKARVSTARYDRALTERKLKAMEGYWRGQRDARPASRRDRCGRCPFSADICPHSVSR